MLIRLLTSCFVLVFSFKAFALCFVPESSNNNTLQCSSWNLVQMDKGSSHALLLTAPDSFSMKFEILNPFEDFENNLLDDKNLFTPLLPSQVTNVEIIKSFNIDKGQRSHSRLTSDEVQEIQQIRDWLLAHGKIEQYSLIHFFTQLPANESLDPLTDDRSGEIPWPLNNPANDQDQKIAKEKKRIFNLLCHKLKQKHTAYYTINNEFRTALVTVGDPQTQCIGRCGFGCPKKKTHPTQYTQECLNHDLCHRQTGENLGICSPHFWRAVDSYLFAPNCVIK